MKRSFNILTFFSLLFIIPLGMHLSAQEYLIEDIINIEDGLPSNETYASFFDDTGDLWILTDKGLAKYDGETVKIYTERDGLPSQTVFKFFKDYKNRIWLTTSKGVCYLHKGVITIPSFNQEIIGKASKEVINNIYVTKDDVVYIAFEKAASGYIKCSIKNNTVVYHKIGVNNSHMFEQIKDSIFSKYFYLNINNAVGVVGVAFQQHKENLSNYDDQIVVLTQTAPPNYHVKYTLTKNSMGKACFLSVGNKLYKFVNKGNVQSVKLVKTFESSILHVSLLENQIYVSCRSTGVYILRNHDYAVLTFIDIKNVSFINPVSKSELWLNTLDNGVIFLNTTFEHSFSLPKEINFNLMTKPVYFDGNELQFFYNKKLYSYQWQPKGLVLKKEQTSAELMRLPLAQKVTWIKKDSVYYGQAFYSCSKHTLKEIINRNNFSSLHKLKSGQHLVYGKVGFGFLTNDFKIRNQSDFLGFKEEVFDVLEAFDSKIYIASNAGLFSYYKNKLHRVFEKSSFTKTRMSCLATNGNELFVGSYGGGIGIISPDSLWVLNENEGLSSSFIQTIKIVNDSVWVGTNKGVNLLYRLSKDEPWKVQSNLFRAAVNDIFKIKNELFVQSEGLFFKLVNLSEQKFIKPQLLALNTKIDGVSSNFQWAEAVKLENNQRSVSLSFRLNQLISPKHLYKYKIDKIDSEWIETNETSLSYNNLPFGEYTLHIKGRGTNGLWSDTKSLQISVVPLLYQRAWFMPLVYVFIGLFLGGIIYQIQKQKAQNAIQKNLVLATSLNALKLQINPHFIFNALNSLQYLIVSDRKKESAKFLSKFANLVRDILNSSEHQFIPISKEIEQLNDYLLLEETRLEKGALTLEVLNLNYLALQQVYIPNLILQPLVENALWHGFLNIDRQPKLKLVIKQTSPTTLIVELIDNGIGIDVKAIEKKGSLAIKNIRERLYLLSKIEKKKYSISFKLLEENNKKTGTKVIITLPLKNSAI